MALGIDEIVAGYVAYLDGDALLSDQSVVSSQVGGAIGTRPFLCIYESGGSSEWLLLTGQFSEQRLCLNGSKFGGTQTWRISDTYVNDVRQLFSGPNASFVIAGMNEYPYPNASRPYISEPCLDWVIAWVNYYEQQQVVNE